MDLTQLKNELSADLPIDLTDLQHEAANNPVVYGKWLRYHCDLKLQLRKYQNERSRELKKQLDYYTGRGDDICLDVYEKSELKTVITATDGIVKIETQIAVVETMIDLCKGSLDAIKNRGFAIKHIIEQRQLEAGR